MKQFLLFAVMCLLGVSAAQAQSTVITGPAGSGQFGASVTLLTNGNYVVVDRFYDEGAITDVGAVYLYDGATHTRISTLKGSTANDQVGSFGITPLSNGNYVVSSPNWSNGSALSVGAVTFGSGTTGVSSVVSSSNSLVGSRASDQVSSTGITALSNGNYVVRSQNWDNGSVTDAGAATFGSGTTGVSGVVSSSNSLVGSRANDGRVNRIIVLSNGNYVVDSPRWDNGLATDAGAATFGSGTAGVSGVINTCNSVVGSIASSDPVARAYNTTYNYTIVAISVENKVVIFNTTAQTLAIHLDNQTQAIAGIGITPFVNNDCRIIATLTPNGSSPIVGSTAAKVWVETTQPTQYVKRHYEITPATDPTTATGRVTLYFTQQDFTDFNTQTPAPALLLPTGASDATGKANFRIEKRGGSSSDGTGAPNTYSGSITTIDPVDSDIVWNASSTRWEVTFDVTGFSGFFAKSQAAPLPVKLLSFTGYKDNNLHRLDWTTATEQNASHFEIQYSATGKDFVTIGTARAAGNSNTPQYYSFDNKNPNTGINYYRLKMIDFDGSFEYSNTITIYQDGKQVTFTAFPNPSENGVFTLQGKTFERTDAIITNVLGQNINITIQNNVLDLSEMPAGVYFLRIAGENNTIRVVKS